MTNRLTLDYGMRFVNQQPQYDQFQQMSNFFPDQWKASAAPVLYVAGCASGKTVCSGNDRNAMDPRTGDDSDRGRRGEHAGGHRDADSRHRQFAERYQEGGRRNREDELRVANAWWWGRGSGLRYDLTGKSDWVLRGGAGLFYDRPDGNTTFSTPGNPPTATAQDLRNGQLATLGQGLSPQPVPTLVTFQYKAKVPASWQWQFGIQKSLPCGDGRGRNVCGQPRVQPHGRPSRAETRQNLNAMDIGAAYLPQNQDPTLGTEHRLPGQTAYTSNLLRPFQGFSGIEENQTDF